MSTFIYIQTQFIATHYWKDAPDDVAFLKNPHRHIFHVRVDFEVKHNDREIEFFQEKKLLDWHIHYEYKNNLGQKSCEMVAAEIFYFLQVCDMPVVKVECNEDGENGAYVTGD